MINRMRFSWILLLLLTFVLSSCKIKQTEVPIMNPEPTKQVTTEAVLPTPKEVATTAPKVFPWWNDTVFYEIFVRSFKDSDGDGIGDFQGIIQQLDYLNDGDPNTTDDLGIGGLWLMPINPSPSYHGYDVIDYYDVNPDYGTMDDFKQLLAEAEKRGIKIIIDLVLNHSSSENPWFLASQNPNSEYHDWYVWSDTDPQVLGPWSQNAWYKNSKNGKYYYAIFWSGMPDLNYDNPDVSAEMMNASKFWLEEVGVDGFRVDAARYLFTDGSIQQDTKETIQWFKDWRTFYKGINPEAFTVGEVWAELPVAASYGQGMDTLFMFDLSEDIIGSVFAPDPSRLIKSYLETLEFYPDQQFSTFLTNHDQQRVMSFFGGNVQKNKLAAFIYLTGPGVPFMYYGEEIGMTGNKPDEFIRTPMQWSAETNAGFTSGIPWEPANKGFEEVNVSVQDDDMDSLLNQYRALVHLRNEHSALRIGEYIPFISSCREIYAVLRVNEDETLLVLSNLSRKMLEGCTISHESTSLQGVYNIEVLFGEGEFSPIEFASDGSVKEYPLKNLEMMESIILKLNQ